MVQKILIAFYWHTMYKITLNDFKVKILKFKKISKEVTKHHEHAAKQHQKNRKLVTIKKVPIMLN